MTPRIKPPLGGCFEGKPKGHRCMRSLQMKPGATALYFYVVGCFDFNYLVETGMFHLTHKKLKTFAEGLQQPGEGKRRLATELTRSQKAGTSKQNNTACW